MLRDNQSKDGIAAHIGRNRAIVKQGDLIGSTLPVSHAPPCNARPPVHKRVTPAGCVRVAIVPPTPNDPVAIYPTAVMTSRPISDQRMAFTHAFCGIHACYLQPRCACTILDVVHIFTFVININTSIIRDKRDRATLWASNTAIERVRSNNPLSRAIGVDRSTISQLLAPDARLQTHVVAECASHLGVSADWLLGLTERPEQAGELIAASMLVTEAPRALVDEQIFAWHKEAQGYKIRHVPAGLPDMLKTHDTLRWEYEPSLGRTIDQAIGASDDRLTWMRGSKSTMRLPFQT